MVRPDDVANILSDAARLVRDGEIVVFGSAALSFRLPDPPHTRDVDVWCVPAERGEIVTALMGELSWYQEKHDAYIEVWGPETFAAPEDWRSRAETLTNEDFPGVRLIVPHPHDILLSKLERWEPNDQAHARQILAHLRLQVAELDRLAARTPYRTGRITDPERIGRFEAHLAELRGWGLVSGAR
jgi:hypothetical protein